MRFGRNLLPYDRMDERSEKVGYHSPFHHAHLVDNLSESFVPAFQIGNLMLSVWEKLFHTSIDTKIFIGIGGSCSTLAVGVLAHDFTYGNTVAVEQLVVS